MEYVVAIIVFAAIAAIIAIPGFMAKNRNRHVAGWVIFRLVFSLLAAIVALYAIGNK